MIYVLNKYPRGPNVGPLRSSISGLQDKRLSKVENATNNLRLFLNI